MQQDEGGEDVVLDLVLGDKNIEKDTPLKRARDSRLVAPRKKARVDDT